MDHGVRGGGNRGRGEDLCAGGGGKPLGRLRERFPEARALDANGRTIAVFGVPMTRGSTAAEAAESFILDHGEVFAEDIDLRPTFTAEIKSGTKTVFGYRQFVQGIPVHASVCRIVVHDTGLSGNSRYAVAYAAGHMANPTAPLPSRILTGPEAIEEARADPRSNGLTLWSVPEEVVLWTRTEGPTSVVRTWKFEGSNDALESRIFWVNARTGAIERVGANTARFLPRQDTTITGTVEGWATPGSLPDTWPDGCQENDPELLALPRVLVESIHNGEVYSSDYTDDSGDYSLSVPNGFSGDVRALLVGPTWTVTDWNGTGTPPGEPPENFAHTCVTYAPVMLVEDDPGSVVDFEFNPSSGAPCTARQYCTASVSAFYLLHAVDKYIHDRVQIATAFPCVDVHLNHPLNECGGQYFPAANVIRLGPVAENGECCNSAQATHLIHEYGHYLVEEVLELPFDDNKSFHEGTGDCLAMIFVGDQQIAREYSGCGTYIRNLETQGADWPVCSASEHARGLLLGGIWWDIWCNLGSECASTDALPAVQDLHTAWLFLATGEQDPPTACNTISQSADTLTLVEVLTADDDDANLSNGTPHDDEICAAFDAHDVALSGDCPESSGGECAADCDQGTGVRVLDVFDFICFAARFETGDPWACAMDDATTGVCDVFDVLAFQNLFALGCH